MRVILVLLVSGLIVAGGWVQLQFMYYENELSSAHVDAELANEALQRVLSRGRWVRTYDSKTGASSYRFAARKEQR